jgi:nucleoside-diphosphate-sugar epimerase
MGQERFLVTGALGCIGAWVVRRLVREGLPTTAFDLAGDLRRLRVIMDDDELAQVRFVMGDIADGSCVKRAVDESGATHVIHLVALQVPACRANPPLGLRVNLVGTANLFEAAKQAGLRRVVYATSIAAYGPKEDVPVEPLTHPAPRLPHTHYGVTKLASEAISRVYWLDDGLSSIGLRPAIVYGPGRDQGLTSGPSRAMLAAALGESFHIPFGGRCDMQYVDDVAQAFIQAARAPFEGAAAFNLRGSVVTMAEVVSAIEAAEPASRGQISFEEKPLPFPGEAEHDSLVLAALGSLPHTPLAEGVAATLVIYKQAISAGRLTAAALS